MLLKAINLTSQMGELFYFQLVSLASQSYGLFIHGYDKNYLKLKIKYILFHVYKKNKNLNWTFN